MDGAYLYAIVGGPVQLDLGDVGLPDGRTPVAAVEAEGLSVVVSPYHGDDFRGLPPPETLRRLMIYQTVMEKVLTRQTPLPIKFGTVVQSVDTAISMLRAYREVLTDALNEVQSAVEIDLSASWDQVRTLKEISREPELAALLARAAEENRNGDSATSLAIGEAAHERLAERRDGLRRQIVGELTRYTRDAEPHVRPTEETVMNVAFLVDRARLSEFDAAVDRLGQDLAETLSFRYVGPLPPYSFATVAVSQPDAAAIERARHVLGLGQSARISDLRDSYRRLAAESHPDRQPGSDAARERFEMLTAARDTLETFMTRSGHGAGTTGDPLCDLRPEGVAERVWLDVVRGDTSGGEQT